jgi:hypothetical protein
LLSIFFSSIDLVSTGEAPELTGATERRLAVTSGVTSNQMPHVQADHTSGPELGLRAIERCLLAK